MEQYVNARLFSLYALTVLLLESLSVLAYVKILPALDQPLRMEVYQIAIALVLVAIAAILGLAAGYHEYSVLDDFGAPGISLSAVLVGTTIVVCASYGYDNVVAMIIAALVAGLLARLADFAIEEIENTHYINLGRY